MAVYYLIKTPAGFKPEPQSLEDWQALPVGQVFKAKITRGRNLKHHRKFFALLKVVMDNLPEANAARWPTTDRLLLELKLQTGRFDMHHSLGDKTVPVPQSISFAKMEQGDFEQFYNDCIDIIVKHIIPGIDEAGLREAAAAEVSTF